MASSIQSSNYPLSVYTPQTQSARLQRQEEQAQLLARQQTKQTVPESEVMPDPERLRRVEAQAEAKTVVLQPFRSADELPKRNQDALAAYRNTLSASLSHDGGELVGLDIYV